MSGDIRDILFTLEDIRDNQELIISNLSGDFYNLNETIHFNSYLLLFPVTIILIYLFVVRCMR